MERRSIAYGRIDINPPLPWEEIKRSPYNAMAAGRDDDTREIELQIELAAGSTSSISVVQAIGVVPSNPVKPVIRYDLEEQLSDLIAQHPGHTFTGAITCVGEDGDRWRYIATSGGKIITERADVTWPSERSPWLAPEVARRIRVDFGDMAPGTPIVGVPYVLALAYGYSTSGTPAADRDQLDRELAERLADMPNERLGRIRTMASRLVAAIEAERDKRLDQHASHKDGQG